MEEEVTSAQPSGISKRDTSHLMKQDLAALDVTKLTPLSPEVISRQATVNIGTIGHVAHGKSTVVKALSGVQTVRFKNELERNITIKLGYANAKIYKKTLHSVNESDVVAVCNSFVMSLSLIGHDILMATMLTGAAVMDAALLLIAGNESCPQPQTSEHLAAVEIMKLKHIIILQNKVDLIKEEQAVEQHRQILAFIEGTIAQGAPVIPISAQLRYNIDVVCEAICRHIPVPLRSFTASPRMTVIRSFDVNKPGAMISELVGGVAGGSIVQGVLKIGDEIEVRPGIVSKDEKGTIKCEPIRSRVLSLYAEENDLQFAVPGGLIGVGTKIDPTLCRSDRLVGHVLGEAGKLPDIFTELEINFFLLRRLLGVKTEAGATIKVQRLVKGEVVMVNIGSTSSGARVIAVKGDLAKMLLVHPVCTLEGEKLALSRRIDKHWRLIGWGKILRGVKLELKQQP